jgi:hypothetical protein
MILLGLFVTGAALVILGRHRARAATARRHPSRTVPTSCVRRLDALPYDWAKGDGDE